MKYFRSLALIGIGLLVTMSTPARADEWNQKTIITFGEPVEVPGQVLTAGTYVFKLADSASDRDIVQVFNQDESHLYGTFLAIPDYRLQPAGKSIVTFEERASGDPEAVKAWFYPGENYGHEFVYPKSKAVVLAKANNQPVPSMPTELAANTTMPTKTTQQPQVVAMKQAPLKAQTQTQEDIEITEVFAAEQAPTTLPHTGSFLPLIALLGVLSLGLATCLWTFRSKQTESK